MGKKKAPEGKAQEEEAKPKPEVAKAEAKPEAKPEVKEAVEEDPPIIAALKAVDDKYLSLEREFEKEAEALQKKYTGLQQPLLDERSKKLADASGYGGEATGTPALKGFWLQAFKHHPAFEDQLEEWDEPVLEYLSDVRKEFVKDTDLSKGFKLIFVFVENPFFTNKTLWKEYHTEESSPYNGDFKCLEIKACDIEWKEGKNVTVEVVKQKVKGGGAKKAAKKAKGKEEPRDSFFRGFFRKLKAGEALPDDVNLDEARQLVDDDDDDELMGLLMENDHEIGAAIRDQLIPFAVRWYTGECAPEDDIDDDDEDDEEDDDEPDEDDEDEEDSEEEEAPKAKAKGKANPKKKAAGGSEGAKNQEDCKQQ
eukprot:gnl/TRDRNA2_/TRDRNA2_82887_c0_seq2.p1 gnl/TRDRNA2_/TRDRNA2_82887_c0~~gnl/TRDRNA2_/TRDRNA2_82887_c0_seq2.p1  ORF type:complete len:366 (+),score=147.24 gnl/TRDRNA2_/TRDRNA2_82887_c0_seq2:54-1151(+)